LRNDLGNLLDQVAEPRSQLDQERADPEEVESKLADLKQNSAPASKLPEAGDVLNRWKTKLEQVQGKRKKPKPEKVWTLKDIEEILEVISEMIEES
jgi:hypothetical protein